MLEHLEETLECLSERVHAGLYRADEAAARAGLAHAESELTGLASEPGDLEALTIYFKLLQFQVDEYFAGSGQDANARKAARAEVLLRTLAELAPPAQTPTGAVMRARTLFHVACTGDRTGIKELLPADGEALAEQVPAADRDNAFWSFMSAWAFDHRLVDPMFTAYTEYLVHRKPMLSRYNWERLRLMYLLTSGQAIFRDVEAVIDRLPGPTKADSFSNYIRPRCEEAGVWDERLQMMLELRSFDLGDRMQEPLPPGLDRHFRRHPWDEPETPAPPAA